MSYVPKQGDIIYLDFNPQSGHEQAGRRPGVIVSNGTFFQKTQLALICPITNTGNKFPLHIPLDERTKIKGYILCEHVKCLDILSKKAQYVEKLPDDILSKSVQFIKTFF